MNTAHVIITVVGTIKPNITTKALLYVATKEEDQIHALPLIFKNIQLCKGTIIQTMTMMNITREATCGLANLRIRTLSVDESVDLVDTLFILIYKNNHQVDYCFIENINLRTILSCWLFVYYYETFLFKQQISQDKLTILIKLLDMELNKTNTYELQDQTKQKAFRIDFMNTFTKFSTLLQEIYLEN
ncbi:unnamed protein product [Adineta steineri]|uniref:Uncharacterized protein n=1 Tax=Adineta steineri TaxID=433720 RepID=A0A814YD91_9BILA|nr:unnamed protein product [Adineta steineri]